ncbi:NPC intracellular cholesterol transporter 2-like [Arctopsyche grandis]|uniref:NPC intracellular cholesterol transporter 2-like n=1 Tax=Arctopsyche grandis TaxID=121162 RepID=UPI00406D8BBF
MFKYIASCIILNLVYFYSRTEATPIQNCATIKPPIFVNITGCDNAPCNFYLGSEAEMLLAFEMPYTSDTLVPRASADLGFGIPIPYPIGDDGCPFLLNGYCPVYEKEVLLYRFALPIDGFPTIKFTLEFKLLGDNAIPITCFKIKAGVVKPNLIY